MNTYEHMATWDIGVENARKKSTVRLFQEFWVVHGTRRHHELWLHRMTGKQHLWSLVADAMIRATIYELRCRGRRDMLERQRALDRRFSADGCRRAAFATADPTMAPRPS